jgi:radical SAM superfamily enzyme YgiQ (UPF0313 family)
MKILLINPIDRKTHGDVIRFPLGLAYISDALRGSGHEVEVLDLAPLEWGPGYLESRIAACGHIDAFGLTGLITEYSNIRDIAGSLKRKFPDKPVVLGGALATSMPYRIMGDTKVDIIVAGEGEVTAKELFAQLGSGKGPSSVAGVYYRKGADVAYTGPREYVRDLDKIGYPSRAGFDVAAYFRNSPFAMFGDRKTLNIITSRGCPYNCSYCDKNLWGGSYRMRSAQNVVSEIEYLVKEFGIDSLIIHDDTFTVNKSRVEEFCGLLTGKGIRLDWLANSRANLIDGDTAKKMRGAGCRIIAYGIESGNQQVLDSMGKNVRIEEAKKAIANTWKAGIVPFAYLMIGWFGETKEQVMDTIEFCVDNRLKGDFSFFTPLPNTPAFEKAKAKMGDILEDEKVIGSWGRWHKKMMVNVSAMSDDELMRLKEYAEKRIFWGHLIDNIFLYTRTMGLVNFAKEIIRRLSYYSRHGFTVRIESI